MQRALSPAHPSVGFNRSTGLFYAGWYVGDGEPGGADSVSEDRRSRRYRRAEVALDCVCLGGGYAEFYGVWASKSVPVTATTNPTLNGPTACNVISESYFRMCPGGTFGLMVDKAAPRPNNPDQVRRFLPPFWEVSMLDGPPSAGVRALPIKVTPVSAPTS